MTYTTDIAKREMEDQAAAVVSYIASPAARYLEIKRDNRTTTVLVAAVPFGIGVILLLGVIRGPRAIGPAAQAEGQEGEQAAPPIQPS